MIPRGGERISGTLKIDGSKNKSVKMSNRIFYSQQFETWVVEVNLSTFAFESKQAAEQFLDDLENGRYRMFVDELEQESEGIRHLKTHSEICRRDSQPCVCSANCNTKNGER